MDETIDLRPYVEALLRHWWVILLAMLAGAALAVLLVSRQTEYRAAALVAITNANQRLILDPRIENTIDPGVLVKGYPEIALSDGVLSAVLPLAETLSDGEISTLNTLQGMATAEASSDPRLLRLVISADSSHTAAELANAWANEFIKAVDAIYGNGDEQAVFYEEQLSKNLAELESVEQALVDFQAQNRQAIVDNELLSLTDLQATYLADERKLAVLLGDIDSLRQQLESGGDDLSTSDQLAAMTLQLRSLSPITPTVSIPIQFQLDPTTSLTTTERDEQIMRLAALQQAAENSLTSTAEKRLALQPDILALQRERQELIRAFNDLERRRLIAEETNATLARKAAEERIRSEDTVDQVRLASLASPPDRPARASLVISALAAMIAGALIAAAAVILVTWWRRTGHAATGAASIGNST